MQALSLKYFLIQIKFDFVTKIKQKVSVINLSGTVFIKMKNVRTCFTPNNTKCFNIKVFCHFVFAGLAFLVFSAQFMNTKYYVKI